MELSVLPRALISKEQRLMSYQEYFNVLLGLVAFLGGWWMKVLWSSIMDLQTSDNRILEKVNAVEVLVAGQYARKEDLDRFGRSIFEKLEKIEKIEVVIANHYVGKEDFNSTIEVLFRKLDKIEEKFDRR